MKEIERKFLVNDSVKDVLAHSESVSIRQGYILDAPDGKTVRVRTKGPKAFLTIKGKTTGISRTEFEYEIPVEDALHLLDHFCPKTLYKDRYKTEFAGKIWEIDVFHGNLEGLIVAEIELQSEEESFESPDWISEEVSDDKRYFNVFLINAHWENGTLTEIIQPAID